MEKLPTYSTDLVNSLDELFPTPVPSVNCSLEIPERELWFRYGQRSVVEKLKFILKQSQENVLEND